MMPTTVGGCGVGEKAMSRRRGRRRRGRGREKGREVAFLCRVRKYYGVFFCCQTEHHVPLLR
jgi:hypothetical protein